MDQRQMNQEQQIYQGGARGQLNRWKANRIERQQDRIDRMENRTNADGAVTAKERARIGAAQNRASRHIAREKQDRQGRRNR
jgi:hypothetical protein